MAKAPTGKAKETIKVSRPGIHSKNKTSKSKGSKLYKKAYNKQGR
jgi:hypothetical protein